MGARPVVALAALTFALGTPACSRRAPSEPAGLVIAYPLGPETLVNARNEEFTDSILGNAFEPLVDLDKDLAVVPGLAESWHTPDALSWVFRLRANARLHDGRPLEAREVAAVLDRVRTDPQAKRRSELTMVERIEAMDDRTLVVTTRFPFALLPNRLANVAIVVPPGNPGAPPTGTGPYRIRSWTSGGDTDLEAFDLYPGGAPPIRTVRFRAVADAQERLRLLRSGDVHLIVDAPPEETADLVARGALRTVSRKGARILLLGLGCGEERGPHVSGARNPLTDVRVRRAIALAIDRKGLVDRALGGEAEVVDQIVAPEVFGYDESLFGRPFDPDGARRLLREAGAGAGFPVDLDFVRGKYRAVDVVVSRIAADLGRVGVRVRPRPREPAVFFERFDRRESAFYFFGWMASGDAGSSYDYLLHTAAGGYGQDNAGRYSNPVVDRLIEEASRVQRPEERRKRLRAIAWKVLDDVPLVPLYRQADLYALSAALEFEPRLDRQVRAARLRWRTPDGKPPAPKAQ